MKYFFLLSIIVCNACHGQKSPYPSRYDLPVWGHGTLEASIRYADSIGRENDKWMLRHGYTKAIDSLELNLNFSLPFDRDRYCQQELNYDLADSTWINKDTTYLMFRYYKKGKRSRK